MDPFTIFAALTAVFGGASIVEQGKANRRSRRAADEQRRMENLRYAKERRSAIRDRNIAFATAQQAAENQGVGTSSGAAGGQGSILSQGAANLAYLQQQKDSADLTAKWLDSAAKAQGSASMFGGLSQLASAGMNFYTPSASAPAKSPTIPVGFKTSGAKTGMGNVMGNLSSLQKTYNL